MIFWSSGCIKISSADGRECGFGSIIKLISCSRQRDLLALGLNLMTPSPAYLSFCHISPFCGRFMPEAISNKDTPRLKISALVVIFSVTEMLFCNNSGAMYTESPSTSSSLS